MRYTKPSTLAATALLIVRNDATCFLIESGKRLAYRIPVRNTAKTAIRFLEDICSLNTTEIGKMRIYKSRMTAMEP